MNYFLMYLNTVKLFLTMFSLSHLWLVRYSLNGSWWVLWTCPYKSLSVPGLSYITSRISPRFPRFSKVPGVLTTTELVFVSFQILDRECGSMPKKHIKDKKNTPQRNKPTTDERSSRNCFPLESQKLGSICWGNSSVGKEITKQVQRHEFKSPLTHVLKGQM